MGQAVIGMLPWHLNDEIMTYIVSWRRN